MLKLFNLHLYCFVITTSKEALYDYYSILLKQNSRSVYNNAHTDTHELLVMNCDKRLPVPKKSNLPCRQTVWCKFVRC